MKVAVYGRALDREISTIRKFFDLLDERQIKYTVFKTFKKHLTTNYGFDLDCPAFKSYAELQGGLDALICLGGDGTMLDAQTLVRNSGLPIMGVNLGRLGFLASIHKNEMPQALDALINQTYTIERRTMLQLESDKALFNYNFALNEFTIQRKETSAMITIHTFLNGELLNSYWADGLIVSTPTGSTGYSLSCGGPIIYPSSDNFVITPVAPHNLNVRPIVVSSDVVISFEVEGRDETFLCTLDSRSKGIDKSYQLAIRKADFTANLIRLNEDSFLNGIREKLYWGIDQRN